MSCEVCNIRGTINQLVLETLNSMYLIVKMVMTHCHAMFCQLFINLVDAEFYAHVLVPMTYCSLLEICI